MKKIMYRSYFALLIAFAVIAGTLLFLGKYLADGSDWVMLRANQSVFSEGRLTVGRITDRNGVVLAHAGEYNDDAEIRKSCLHAVGDYTGNIGSGALQLFNDRLAGYDPVNGITNVNGKGGLVKLSIDSELNKIANQALYGRRGAVIVSNYKTGEVICMVSSPNYDPAAEVDLSSPSYEGVFLNRAIGATYTPGSVYKIITLIAAIDTLPELDSMTFTCNGSVQVGGDTVTCTGTHGSQNIEQAFSHSCNCAFSELAQTLGADVLAQYAEKLGITKSFSLNGASTLAGSFEKAEAGTSNLSWSAIGQYTDLASPYAMLRIVSAVANGGVVEEPTLLKNGKTTKTQLIDPETADKVASFMSYNIANAYGQGLFPGLSIGAKTGTAEVGDGTDNAWFVGFLSDDAHPYAFAVCIEKGGGGLRNAGPVANAVLQAAVAK